MTASSSELRTSSKQLDTREKLFVHEYCIDLDAKRAAIEAGYSRSVAAKKAYSWVGQGGSKPHVYAAIEERMTRTCIRLELSAERIENELMKIAFASMRTFIRIDETGQPHIDFSDADECDLDAIAEFSTEAVIERQGENGQLVRKSRIKLHAKLDALEKLAKRLRFYRKSNEDRSDAFAQAFEQIWARGSKAPINCVAMTHAASQSSGDLSLCH